MSSHRRWMFLSQGPACDPSFTHASGGQHRNTLSLGLTSTKFLIPLSLSHFHFVINSSGISTMMALSGRSLSLSIFAFLSRVLIK